MDQQQAPANQITVFYSYAHADERLRQQLETHLGLLRQQRIIATWHERQIVPGTDWVHEIDTHLSTARIILLLISPDFLASDYCYGVELRRAMERHEAGEARVIPILLRPVADWDKAPFVRLAVLPTNKMPITKWRHRDEAWANVASGIRRAIEPLQATAGSFPHSSKLRGVSDQIPTRIRYRDSGGSEDDIYSPGEVPHQRIHLRTYNLHANWVDTVAWSPDGTYIASGGGDGTVRVWDAATGNNLHTYHAHPASSFLLSNAVFVVAWSPDGTRIAFGGGGTGVQIWNVATEEKILTYSHQFGWLPDVFAVAWSPDGQCIASRFSGISIDKTVQVWNANTGDRILTYCDHLRLMDFIEVSSLGPVAWSPNGTYIASSGGDKTIPVWNAATGKTFSIYRGHCHSMNTIAWSPDGTYIASAAFDEKTVHLWNPTTGHNVLIYHGHSDTVRGVAWSPDGTRIASGSKDKTVRIWDSATGQHIFTYRGHSDKVNSVAWSPDGTRIASGSDDKTVQIWQASSFKWTLE